MTLGQRIAKLLIESGKPWTVAMLAKHFDSTHNSVTNALATTRRHCTLHQKKTREVRGTPQFVYSALSNRGHGLLYTPPPQITMKPYIINDPFHPKHDQ